MRLKTFIITGLTGLLCSCTHAQQAQYWKETPYDLENVDFDTDVAKFFSKAQAITDTTTFLTDNPLKYILEKHTLGDTVIYDYEVNGVKYSEKVAKYGKIIFPYIAMIADEQRKMAGLISKTYINNPQTLDLLISSLAKQYGWEATVIRQYKKNILVWEKDGKKVVLRAMEPGNEGPTTAIFITKDQNGKIINIETKPQPTHKWYPVTLYIVRTDYARVIAECTGYGEWENFYDYELEPRSIRNYKGICSEEVIVDIDPSAEGFNFPGGTLPVFTTVTGEKSNNQTFFSEFGRFLIAHLEPGIPEYGEVTMRFIIDREGKAKNVEIKGEGGYGAIMAMDNLPLFKPAALNGREVGVRLTLTVRFNSYF